MAAFAQQELLQPFFSMAEEQVEALALCFQYSADSLALRRVEEEEVL